MHDFGGNIVALQICDTGAKGGGNADHHLNRNCRCATRIELFGSTAKPSSRRANHAWFGSSHASY
jgi:hypothetical protein